MASYKQIAARISAARASVDKAVALAKVIDPNANFVENQFLQNELTRIAGRLEGTYNIAMDLEYRKED